MTQTTPYDSPGTLVCWCQRSRRSASYIIYFAHVGYLNL